MSEIQMIKTNENNIEMSNISKDNNCFQIYINSIEERKIKFWNIYSKFLIHFSWLILILSLFITISLTICFIYLMKIRQFDQKDFLIQNSRALNNIQYLQNIFGNDKNFRVHQQMELYPALDVIIKRKLEINNQTNMLNNDIINEIHSLDNQIQSIRINNSDNSIQYNYSSLCAIMNHGCMIDGNYLLSNKFRQDVLHLPYIASGIYVDSLTGANGIASFIFGKSYQVINVTSTDVDYQIEDEEEDNIDLTIPSSFTEIVSYVPIFRLRYSLNVSNNIMNQLSINWEREVLRYLNEKFQSTLITLSASSSTAIADAIGKQAHDEGPFMAIMLLIFFIFICFFISIQGNFHTSVGYLSLCGIISFILSSGATFGLLSIAKVRIIEPMTLLVFAVAIIDCIRISIICGEYHRIIKEHLPLSSTNISTKIDIEKILPSILKSTYPYFFSSTIIIIIVYLILSFISPMSGIRYLGLTLILYIFINYLIHCTFFLSCFIITLKRIQSRRHCLLCTHLPNDYYIRERRKLIKKNFFQEKKKFFLKINIIFKKLFTGFICLVSFIFILYSIWIIFLIDTNLFNDKFLPRNSSSLRSYMKSQIEDYDIGPVIMFTIPQEINYENKTNQLLIRRIIEQCQNEKNINNFKLLWLDYDDIITLTTSKDPIYLRITPYSQNDLIILDGKDKSVIKSSRFYCQYRSIKGDREDLQTMNNMYKYAQQSSIPSIFPYSIVFPHYESLGQIRIEILLLILLIITISFLIIFLMSISFGKALLIFSNLIVLLCGSLTCLYLFHNLTFNFANALWFYIIPIIYLDILIHGCFNIKKSKWKYNRVILSLIISLIIFSFFPIETYIFHMIRNSLIYQSIICFIIINIIFPSWYYIIKSMKKKKEKIPPTITIIDKNQSSIVDTEIENLVHEPNGKTHSSS